MARFVFFCSPMLIGSAAFGELRDRYTISDGGRSREFIVARDEIHTADRNRRPRRQAIAGLASAEAARLAAERHAIATGEEADVVLYEDGAPRNTYTRRIVTKQIAVRLLAGADAAGLAARLGLTSRGEHAAAKGWFIFESPKTGGALESLDALRADGAVVSAEPQLARQWQKRLVPNDPLFNSQWHLRDSNPSAELVGIDVRSVWDTWRGSGVRIGIVDDGLQTTHPDLAPNVDTINDHDWNDSSPNTPDPDVTADFHGTACAGVAAARGNNSLGVSGVAPEATLVGLRLIAGPQSDTNDAEAVGWASGLIQVKSNSWGPLDNGVTLEAPGSLTAAALETAATTGRGGLGTIFVWAAGNGGDMNDNSNYDGFANSRFTIAVAAVGNDGVKASYSEPGANVLVAAPSDGASLGIVTTDLTGADGYNDGTLIADANYTNDFGGTSSACPLVAGCVALVLQAKPTLGWRDVQEILLRSASKIAPTDSDWVNNGAGFHFNHKYGAGLVNAQAAVNLATTWTNLPPLQSVESEQANLSVTIPDNNSTGITRTFNLGGPNLRVERATMTVTIAHTSRGQLAVTLTSPAGTPSRLAEVHSDTGNNYSTWTFSTVRCWGENSTGNWTLKVTDTVAGTTGTLSLAKLTVYGTQANQPPVITSATLSDTRFSDETLSVTNISATDAEGDAITFTYAWEESTDDTTFTPISGATGSSLALTNAQSGRKVRAAIVASAAGESSATFRTPAVAINRRPIELARDGAAYSYDSDLFLVGSPAFTRAAIINEFSQGPSGLTREWVELLVLQTSDLRGCTLGDLSTTQVTFANIALWSSVPAGTLIVVYKGTDRDTRLPADDLDPAGGTMMIANNDASAFIGTTWPSLSNSNPDAIVFRSASGSLIDGLSFNGDTAYAPAIASVGSTRAAQFNGNAEAGAEVLANWSVVAETASSPAVGNGAVNSAFVSALRNGTAGGGAPQFRLAATSDLVPGLTIDPATGVLSGIPAVPGGGLFRIIIERFTASSVVSQTFPLLVADAAGHFTIPAGKTWTLDQATTLPTNLAVNGTIDTNGHALVVNGTVTVAVGANVSNAAGSITYLQRSGSALPGTTFLLANVANDQSDFDHDGANALVEFALGLDPSHPDAAGLPSVASVDGHLTLTFRTPVGASGVSEAVQVSGDLVNWQSGAGFTETMSDSTAAGLRTIVVRDVATAPPRYIRLRVSR